jgi:hypothetical protein
VSLSLGTGLVACAPDLPVDERIAVPRVLALRTEVSMALPLPPGDPPDGAKRCEALPFEAVRIRPFMVTPDGVLPTAGAGYDPQQFDPIWIACNLGPGQGLFACLRAAVPLELDKLPACPVPSLGGLDPTAMELPETPSPCLLPADASPDGEQEFVIPFGPNLLIGGDLEITMISRGPGSPDTRACAEAMLGAEKDLPDECIYAVTRVSVGPVEKLLSLAAMFGFMLPPELGEPPDPKDIPDGDRNPRIASFVVTLVPKDGDPTELGPKNRGDVVKVKPGDTLRIDTETPEGDLQTYPVQINAGAGGMSSETQTERLSGDWYRTWGQLLSGSSNDPKSFNEWTMKPGEQDPEGEVPEGGRATLFYVLRDSRLGVDWWWLDVEVAP